MCLSHKNLNSFLIYLKITLDFSSLIQEQHLNFVHFIKKINFTIEITKLIVYNSSTMEDKILDCIKNNNLINPGEFIGVAVSGGADSMALLNVLNENKENLDCEIVAITIDHMLRGEESLGDAMFVKNFCNEHHIPCWKFSVDAERVAENEKVGVEEGARIARYGVFDKLLSENKVDKIALAHHLSDQAETILMHILRGAGLNGACGMNLTRNNSYIRPMLDVSKEDLLKYCAINEISYVDDETNMDTTYNRNFIRNIIMPELKKRWEGVEQNLVNFSKACKEDNEFILSHVRHDGVIFDKTTAKIPLSYFHYAPSVINRIIFDALNKINIYQDIERKHIELIKSLESCENGKKINLPNNLVAQKEYDYITLYVVEKKEIIDVYPLKTGKTNFADICQIEVKKTKDFDRKEGTLLLDANKVPSSALWRTRKTGDKFTKFGGGSKSLKNYLIDKKIPNRLRDSLPVLADGSEILCVLGVEISDKVKIDENTKFAYIVTKKDISKKNKNA